MSKIIIKYSLLSRVLQGHFILLGNVYRSGPGCSKLTTSLVNVSLKFQMLISEICQYLLLKKCEKLLHSVFIPPAFMPRGI